MGALPSRGLRVDRAGTLWGYRGGTGVRADGLRGLAGRGRGNIFKDSREKITKDINDKKETLENQINEEIKKAEKEVEAVKKNAPEKINRIAIEASSDLVKKLIGAEINNSSISAIVDDLSKKNGDKYYGN